MLTTQKTTKKKKISKLKKKTKKLQTLLFRIETKTERSFLKQIKRTLKLFACLHNRLQNIYLSFY
jgi:hypothetical protein